jgi:Protein of unknown function (DUF2723)
MNFRKVNNITGWLVFLVALATYFFTREARGSLWDTGEFIASAKGLMLPHPPGAPMFTLLGRFFIILFGDDGKSAGAAVNFMSALASAGTILFLFWSITHFARKMFVGAGEQLDSNQLFTTMVAGVVGGLAYTFSDSFWFSAVEGEVYSLSSFFTALVFWAMLKWEHSDELAGADPYARARSDRWIVFFFFMMGLSIGVHLLNLLTIPAIVMIYYYRRYKATNKGAIWAFVIGCAITGLVQLGVIQYSMKAAAVFDVFFVNSAKMPFFSGFTIYFLLVAAAIWWGLRLKEKSASQTTMIIWFNVFLILVLFPFFASKGAGLFDSGAMNFIMLAGIATVAGYFFKPSGLKVLKLSLWAYAFMMLGYFMYFTTLIRSNANPTIDMNNVDNPINLVYYLSREQYGSAPLLYGPHFSADYDYGEDGMVKMKDGEMKYVKGDGKYIPTGRDRKPTYAKSDMQFFPRIWDASNDQYHAEFYASWLNIEMEKSEVTGRDRYVPPTFGQNMEWFFSYQMSFMYWRYFMWNFAGKQNDVQGLGNKRDGNWISGISFMDNQRLGDQSKIPDSIKNNKANNKLYMIPFILGIIGCVYQFLKNKKDWIVNFLLFFFTGIAVVLYLNQPGNQPRERDYAYVGSFYAFALWIGLAVVAFVKMAKEKEDKKLFGNMMGYGSVLTFLITLMSCMPSGTGGNALMASLIATALFAIVLAGITFLARAVSSQGNNGKALNLVAGVACLIAPLLMAQQEWDDHDRSHKTTAPDMAKDYLESCAPNAIIFTFGDNDTYPLWYAQEVEGVRKDIRVINNSLLGIDWYINQLRYKVNTADSLDVIWSEEQIEGHNREYLRGRPQADPNQIYDLYSVMKNEIGKPVVDEETGRDVGGGIFPYSKFKVPVDVDLVKKNGTASATDSVLSEMFFEISEKKLNGGLMRSDLIILNIIASNKWKRPIYFTSPFGELGFYQYLRKDGLAYRLVPVVNKYPQQNWTVDGEIRQKGLGGTQIMDNGDSTYKNLMTKYEFGGAGRKGMYYDEENRRHLLNLRALYGEAAGNLADLGKKDEALALLDKMEKGISTENLPYAMVSRYNSHNQTGLLYLEAAYKAGRKDLVEKIKAALQTDLKQQEEYYTYIKNERSEFFEAMATEELINSRMVQVMAAIIAKYEGKGATPEQTVEGNKSITNPGKVNTPADTGKKPQ